MLPWHQRLRERPAMVRYAYTLLTPFFTEIVAQDSKKNCLTHDLSMTFSSNASGTHFLQQMVTNKACHSAVFALSVAH